MPLLNCGLPQDLTLAIKPLPAFLQWIAAIPPLLHNFLQLNVTSPHTPSLPPAFLLVACILNSCNCRVSSFAVAALCMTGLQAARACNMPSASQSDACCLDRC